MTPLLLVLLLGAQSTGQMSPTSALDFNRVHGRSLTSRFRDTLNVRDTPFSATGDGSTDDRAAIQAAIDYAQARSGGKVFLPCGTYRLGAALRISGPVSLEGQDGCTLLRMTTTPAYPDNTFLTVRSYPNPISGPYNGSAPGSTTLSRGDTSLTFTSVSGVSAGDTVMLFLGTDPYDGNEELIRMFNVVESVVGTTVTFRIPVPEDIPAGARTHGIIRPTQIAENILIRGIGFDRADGLTLDQTAGVAWARNVRIENVYALNSASSFSVTESENVTIDGLYWKRGDASPHTTAGHVLMFWGNRNCAARNIVGAEVDRGAILESQNRGIVLENVAMSSGPAATGGYSFFHVAGGSKQIAFRNVRLSASPSARRPGITVIQGAEVTQQEVTIDGGMTGTSLKGILGGFVYEGTRYSAPKRWSMEVRLTPSATIDLPAPRGLYVDEYVYVTTTTGLTNVYFLNWDNGQGLDVKPYLVPGEASQVAVSGLASIGSTYPFNGGGPSKRIAFVTGADMPAGSYARVSVDYIPVEGDTTAPSAYVQDTSQLVRSAAVQLGGCTHTSAASASGACKACDVVWNSSPVTSWGPLGWRCVSSGTWSTITSSSVPVDDFSFDTSNAYTYEGTWAITQNRLYNTDASGFHHWLRTDSTAANQRVKVLVRSGSIFLRFPLIALRAEDADNMTYVLVYGSGFQIFDRVAGVDSQLGGNIAVSVANDTYHALEASISGATVSVTYNGTTYTRTTSRTGISGTGGVAVSGTGVADVQFDDLYIETIP